MLNPDENRSRDRLMDASQDAIQILQYLLPGFLAAWIYYGLTPFTKPSEFERVVQALIFTLIIQSIVFLENYWLVGITRYWTQDRWAATAQIAAPALTAIVIGLTFAAFANNDWFHWVARKARITKETSYQSQWFSAFARRNDYVVLQLKDERRIYGWPVEWPSDLGSGQFVLQRVSWLTEQGEQPVD